MKCIVYGLYSSREPEAIRYIGQTKNDPRRRLAAHKNYAKHKTTAVHKWLMREIEDGFDVTMRVLCNEAVLHETEVELIAQYRALGARLLNLTDGGEGTVGWHGNKGNKRPDLAERNRLNAGKPTGRKMSLENKAKLREANRTRDKSYLVIRNKTNHPWLGKKHKPDWFEKVRGLKRSQEVKDKMSAAMKGRIFTDEHRRKIGEASRGRVHSAETRAKISAGNLGRLVSEETRRKLRLSWERRKNAQTTI